MRVEQSSSSQSYVPLKEQGGREVSDALAGKTFTPEKELVLPGEGEIIQAIEDANDFLEAHYTRFEFTIHDPTKQILVKVIDTNTDEVIREIPPEKILNVVAKLWEIAGILVDEKR